MATVLITGEAGDGRRRDDPVRHLAEAGNIL